MSFVYVGGITAQRQTAVHTVSAQAQGRQATLLSRSIAIPGASPFSSQFSGGFGGGPSSLAATAQGSGILTRGRVARANASQSTSLIKGKLTQALARAIASIAESALSTGAKMASTQPAASTLRGAQKQGASSPTATHVLTRALYAASSSSPISASTRALQRALAALGQASAGFPVFSMPKTFSAATSIVAGSARRTGKLASSALTPIGVATANYNPGQAFAATANQITSIGHSLGRSFALSITSAISTFVRTASITRAATTQPASLKAVSILHGEQGSAVGQGVLLATLSAARAAVAAAFGLIAKSAAVILMSPYDPFTDDFTNDFLDSPSNVQASASSTPARAAFASAGGSATLVSIALKAFAGIVSIGVVTSMQKALAKAFQGTAAQLAALTRTTAILRAGTAAGQGASVGIPTRLLAASTSASASISRLVGALLVASTSGAAAIQRAIASAHSATAGATGTMKRAIAAILSWSAMATTSIANATAALLGAAGAGAASAVYAEQKLLTVLASGEASVARSATRSAAAAARATTTLIAQQAITLAQQVNPTTSLARAIGAVLSVSTTPTGTVASALNFLAGVVAAAVGSSNRLFGRGIQWVANVAGSLSSARQAIHTEAVDVAVAGIAQAIKSTGLILSALAGTVTAFDLIKFHLTNLSATAGTSVRFILRPIIRLLLPKRVEVLPPCRTVEIVPEDDVDLLGVKTWPPAFDPFDPADTDTFTFDFTKYAWPNDPIVSATVTSDPPGIPFNGDAQIYGLLVQIQAGPFTTPPAYPTIYGLRCSVVFQSSRTAHRTVPVPVRTL